MNTLLFTVSDPRDPVLQTVGEILRRGGLAAIPTETVYGLAANALDDEAVRGIFRAKGRPADNPLIVHISDLSQWAPLVLDIPAQAKQLADAFWPGPLTVILPKSARVSSVLWWSATMSASANVSAWRAKLSMMSASFFTIATATILFMEAAHGERHHGRCR